MPPPKPTTAIGVKVPGYFWACTKGKRYATLVFVSFDHTAMAVHAVEPIDVSSLELLPIPTPREMLAISPEARC